MTRTATLSQLNVAHGQPLVWGRRTYIMGIINVTPDSFSGDGLVGNLDAIVRRAVEFQEAGADFIDVGAASCNRSGVPLAPAAA